MSADRDLEDQLNKAKAKWDSLTPAQQAKYLRTKVAELDRQIEELDREANKPKQ